MTPASIANAKKLAQELRARGVLILAFGGDRFSAASYGWTRVDCDAMRQVNERIAELISDGTIEIPERLRQEVT